MMDETIMDKCPRLLPEMFHDPAHRFLFRLFREMREGKTPITPVTSLQRIYDRGKVAEIGNGGLINEIADFAFTWRDWQWHRDEIIAKFHRRKILEAAEAAAQAVYSDAETTDIVDALADAIADIGIGADSERERKNGHDMAEAVTDFLSNAQTGITAGIPTGIRLLDQSIAGISEGLYIVGGKTGSGKTVLCAQIAEAVVRASGRVIYFSLEVGFRDVGMRLVCRTSGIPNDRLRQRVRDDSGASPVTLSHHDYASLTRSIAELSNQGDRWAVYDTADTTMDQLRQKVRADVANFGAVDCVVVDYIQLVNVRGAGRERHELAISEMVESLKKMSREMKCAVIAPSQLNDQGQLYACKAISHHADVVMIIRDEGIFLEKVRNGPRGITVPVTLNGALQVFDAVAEPSAEPMKEASALPWMR